jgi:hypothetical protein
VLPTDVERGRDEKKGWGDGTLEEALKRSEHHELGEVVREGNAQYDDPPAEHADKQSLVQAEALHQVISRSFADKVCDVEDGAQPF